MRSYEDMVESGDWPPTNRETIRMLIGMAIGICIGYGLCLILNGLAG